MESELAKLNDKILHWLAFGERGLSSEAMAFTAVGKPPEAIMVQWPHDPDDFQRCLKLLIEVPEVREHFDAIAALSPEWKLLIAEWDALEALFREEAPGWPDDGHWRCPKTFDAIQRTLEKARSIRKTRGL